MGSTSVIIPPLQLHTILNKPENEIEAMDSQNETLQASYTIQDKEIYVNSIHFNVVNKQLTRDIPSFIESIAEELALGFQRYWGTSTEWKTVGAWDTCQKIVARTANRVFLGTTLCTLIPVTMYITLESCVLQKYPRSQRSLSGSLEKVRVVRFRGRNRYKHDAIDPQTHSGLLDRIGGQ